MAYIDPKRDYKDGDILYGIDLNASNATIKAGVDDNFDRIQSLETSKQDNLTAGTGIEITEDNVINNTQTSAEWGNVQGNIEDQTDLQNVLESKQDVIDSSNKLDYSLLDNTPSIPSKTSDLTNDSGFIDNTYHDSTKQDVLTAGTGIDITGNVISNTQTSAEWGSITGTLEDQTDLNSALGDKQDTLVSGTNIKTINNISLLGAGDIQIGGGSGGTSNYNELANKPQINGVTLAGNQSTSDLGINIPTKVSDLNNDSGFITSSYHDSTKQDVIDSSNKLSYNYLSDTPTIPTNLSDLNNDNNTVTDASYVHTDNNYTTAEKSKLAGVDDIIVVGSETPTSQTELIFESIDLDAQYTESEYYSTNEVKTNKVWIDGKPIYRKVITFTTDEVSGSWKNYSTGVSNLDKMISIQATIERANYVNSVPYEENANGYIYMTYVKSSRALTCKVGSDLTSLPVVAIIEYTKTTD